MENQTIEQKYIVVLENTLQLSQEIENLRDQLRSLTELCLSRSDRLNKENTELQNQITALQKENEDLRGEKCEGITKETRDTFEMVKGLSQGYVMALETEAPEYIPLNDYLDAGGKLGDVKRVKIGIQVYDLLRIVSMYDGTGMYKCCYLDRSPSWHEPSEILVYNTLQK